MLVTCMQTQNYWYVIPAELAESGKPQKALLYGLISSLTQRNGICTASNDFLAKKLGRKDKGTISELIIELQAEGWISIRVDKINGNKREIKLIVGGTPIRKKPHRSSEKTVDPYTEKTDSINKMSNIKESNIKSIAEASSADGEVIPDLLKDKQKHIQIIGLWARAKKVNFTSKEHQRSYIRRNLRPARDLTAYPIDKIMEVMAYLIKQADFKATLESVGKYIDEPSLMNLNNKKSKFATI